MSPLSSQMFFVALLVGFGLTPVTLTQSLNAPNSRTGSLHILQPASTDPFKGWVDKGSELGNAFKVIWQSGDDQEQDQGSFFYEDFGAGIPVEIFCSRCGTDPLSGQPVDLQLGTAMGHYNGLPVWFPIAVQTKTPGFEYQIQRRDPTRSTLWKVDSNDVVTPMLLDSNGTSVTKLLNVDDDDAAGCNLPGLGKNCNMWWGPDSKNKDPSEPYTMQFSQTAVEPAWGPPIDDSEVLCIS